MIILEVIRNYIYSNVGVKGNVKPNNGDNSFCQLDPEEITKDFWIKKYQLI